MSDVRVVRWVTWDEGHNLPGAPEGHREALLDCIRENGYKFGGYTHQSTQHLGAPVFSDGTSYTGSLRSWGGVMAAAWGPEDPMAYCAWAWVGDDVEGAKVPEG